MHTRAAYKAGVLKGTTVDFSRRAIAEIGSTDGIVKVIGDCAEMGIPVLPPDINESRKNFAAVGTAIRFGLAAIKGVGDQAAESILLERSKKSFASFTDLANRLDPRLVNKRTLDALICAGALDSLGKNRATLTAASEMVAADAARRREDAELGRRPLTAVGRRRDRLFAEPRSGRRRSSRRRRRSSVSSHGTPPRSTPTTSTLADGVCRS